MERKAVFFDADGTVSHLIKGVPASAEAAIHALQDKGHLAFLCTGRSVRWWMNRWKGSDLTVL